jgi:drug/metabolite transporter (DMT)-like permease
MKIKEQDPSDSMAKRQPATKGIMLMLSAAFLFGVMVLIIKIMGPKYRVWDIATFRLTGGAVILLILFGWKENFFKPKNPRLILIRGVIGSMTFFAFVAAIRLIPMSVATVFFYSFPAFAAIFSFVLFKDRISLPEILCVFLALTGVGVLMDFKFQGALFGQIMGAVSGVLAGLTVSMVRELRKTHSSAMIYFYFCLIGGILSFGPFMADPHLPQNAGEWGLIGGLLIVATGGQLLMTQGFQYCKSWEGGLFLTTELLFTTLFGIVFLCETVSWRFWIGGTLILTSAVLTNIKSMPSIKNSSKQQSLLQPCSENPIEMRPGR